MMAVRRVARNAIMWALRVELLKFFIGTMEFHVAEERHRDIRRHIFTCGSQFFVEMHLN